MMYKVFPAAMACLLPIATAPTALTVALFMSIGAIAAMAKTTTIFLWPVAKTMAILGPNQYVSTTIKRVKNSF